MDYRFESCCYIAIFAFIIILSLQYSFRTDPGCECKDGQALIFGGSEANIEYFPYHVGIYINAGAPGAYKQVCGGTLISTTLVVSAAHCFWNERTKKQKDKSLYRVAAGKTHRAWRFEADIHAEQRRKVAQVTLPRRYLGRSQSLAYDIAVVRLNKAVTLTGSVGPAKIDWYDTWTAEQLAPGSNGTAAGWGVSESGVSSETLKFVTLPYVDPDTCFDSLPQNMQRLLSHDKFCAGYLNSSTSVCPGDSGGGLVFHHEATGKNFLRGIVSMAFKPAGNTDACFAQHYAAFTMVTPKVVRELIAHAEQRKLSRAPPCGQPLIARGQNSTEAGFPWHAAVHMESALRKEDFSYVCGGSLIAPKFVVTAAHCFYDDDSSRQKDFRLFQISAGTTQATSEESQSLSTPRVQTFRVASVAIHKEYAGSRTNFANNIAVVRLDRAATLTPTVAPVCVDWDGAYEDDLRDGAEGVVSAIGVDSSISVRWVTLPYVNLEACATFARSQNVERLVFAQNFCVGTLAKSQESCRSDAGGGFSVYHASRRRYFLRGVVVVALGHSSYRVQCYSDGYTLVQATAPFVEWIQNVISSAELANT